MAQRDSKGRFIKGQSGNLQGRPVGLSITALIDAVVTTDDWLFIINKLREKARRGDMKAIDMLTNRRFGKAPQPLTDGDGNAAIIRVDISGGGNG